MSDLAPLAPTSVQVVFPGGHEKNVTLASLSLTQYSGVETNTGSTVLLSSHVYDGTNGAALDTLAQQLATDYYLWQLAKLDMVFAFLCSWTPEGTSDYIEWLDTGIASEPDALCSTRIQRGAWYVYVEPLTASNFTTGELEGSTVENSASGIRTILLDVGPEGTKGSVDNTTPGTSIFKIWDMVVGSTPRINDMQFTANGTGVGCGVVFTVTPSYLLHNDESDSIRRCTLTFDLTVTVGAGGYTLTVDDDTGHSSSPVDHVSLVDPMYTANGTTVGVVQIHVATPNQGGYVTKLDQSLGGRKKLFSADPSGAELSRGYLEFVGNDGSDNSLINFASTIAAGGPNAFYIGWIQFTGTSDSNGGTANMWFYVPADISVSGTNNTYREASNMRLHSGFGYNTPFTTGSPPSGGLYKRLEIDCPIQQTWTGPGLGIGCSFSAAGSVSAYTYDTTTAGVANSCCTQVFCGGVFTGGTWTDPGRTACHIKVVGNHGGINGTGASAAQAIEWVDLTAGTLPYGPSSPSAWGLGMGVTCMGTGAALNTIRTDVDNNTAAIAAIGGAGSVTPAMLTIHPLYAIFDHYADAGNSTSSETDLYSDSIPAATLDTNGDKLEAKYTGVFVISATDTRRFRVYIGGQLAYDSGALASASADTWECYVTFVRVNSTTIRCIGRASTSLVALPPQYTEVTVSDLHSNATVLKITGTSAGVSPASNDIVAKIGLVSYEGAA